MIDITFFKYTTPFYGADSVPCSMVLSCKEQEPDIYLGNKYFYLLPDEHASLIKDIKWL